MRKEKFLVKDYPEKSWSISRIKSIKSCLREYYYTYYGSHRGWEPEVSLERKRVWRLKKLTNIWIAFGDIIHEGIKGIVKYKINNKDSEIDVDKFKSFVRLKLNNIVRKSSRKGSKLQWDEYPNGQMLQEYYYEGKLDSEDISEVKERIEQCVENFFESKTFFDIQKGNFLKVLEVDEGNFDYIFINGVKVFAIIDMLYIDDKGHCIIVDWKSGKHNEDNKEQLLVYALYVMEKYKIPVENIRGRIEYLFTGENYEFEITNEEIEEIKLRVEQEINVIDAMLSDKEINKPKDKEMFIMRDEDYKCNKCKYKILCEEERGENDENTRN
ncbi:PD-(D/E)XK nuclease family protein [Clostridium sardiniense]|uniref:PD-(D/E)XK nuclease family protein n=1 Tax=Clostridium sardiniense TaxID=29369 RepID=UPI003D341652